MFEQGNVISDTGRTDLLKVSLSVQDEIISDLNRQIEANRIVMSVQDEEIARLKAIISNVQTVLGAK